MIGRNEPEAADPAIELPLPRLTPQIEDIAHKVSKLVAMLSDAPAVVEPTAGEGAAAFARQLHKERRLRDSCFAADIFGEPAWDILLDLFASEGEAISIASACHAAGAPPSTALRYLNVMLGLGLIVKRPAAEDERATCVGLSDAARDRMNLLLNRMMAGRSCRDDARDEVEQL